MGKNGQKFFLNQIRQFIHQSKALVEYSRNMLLRNFFWVIFGLKKPKNSVKIRYIWAQFLPFKKLRK
jgi:hypothetical protein